MGYFYAIAAAVTRGFVYAIDQRILGKVSPQVLMLINSIFSIIILLPILLYSKKLNMISSLDWGTIKIICLSLVFTLIANLLILFSIQHIGSSRAAILEIAYPFFVVIFSILMFKEQINIYFIIGAILLFTGSAIIVKFG